LQETYYKRTMLRKEKINLRKAKILGMYAIDLSTARPKWRQTPVIAYICLYQELNLKIVEYTYLSFADFSGRIFAYTLS